MHFASNLPQPTRSLALPLMAAAVLGAGVATATFALVNIEDEPIVSLETPASEPAVVPSDAVAGQRNDGGPAEGAAVAAMRAQPAQSSSVTAAGTRYDGGPAEGAAVAAMKAQPAQSSSVTAAAAGTRYDGGPEEGSRAVVTEQPDASGAGGPTPFGGARP